MVHLFSKSACFALCFSFFSFFAYAQNPFTTGNGSKENPYIISNQFQLAYIAQQVNNRENDFEGIYFELSNDIQLNRSGPGMDPIYGWTPIGKNTLYSNIPFKGNFDGRFFTITDFFTVFTKQSGVGFFGHTENACIKNLNITCNGNIEGDTSVGTVVGYNQNSKIEFCNIYGNNFFVKAKNAAGAIAGENIATNGNNASISYVVADINVVANQGSAGGIVALNQSTNGGKAVVKNVLALGNVTGGSSAGGVVVFNSSHDRVSESIVEAAIAMGNVSSYGGADAYAGGVVGGNYGNDNGTAIIRDVVAFGNVDSKATFVCYAGGILGLNMSNSSGNSSLMNAFATGTACGNGPIERTFVGGIVGYNSIASGDTNVSISTCYANTPENGFHYLVGNNNSVSVIDTFSIQQLFSDQTKLFNSNSPGKWRANYNGLPHLNAFFKDIVFDYQGENTTHEVTTISIGEYITQPVNHALFNGWFTKPVGGQIFNFNKQRATWITVDTLYAQ